MNENFLAQRDSLALIGLCLLCVQRAEYALSSAVESILDRSNAGLSHQPESKQKKTLGEFLHRLKRTVRVDRDLKDRLFRFLEMRNTFVHNLSEVPGWSLKTPKGREVAEEFLAELALTALYISALFGTLFSISAKDEFGKNLFEDRESHERRIMDLLENQLGPAARSLLAGRMKQA